MRQRAKQLGSAERREAKPMARQPPVSKPPSRQTLRPRPAMLLSMPIFMLTPFTGHF